MFKVGMPVVLLWITAITLWSQSAPLSGDGSSSDSGRQAAIPIASVPVHIGEKEMRHFVLKKAHPVYSPLVLQSGIQGTVVLRVIVDRSGVPTKISAISGHPVLVNATMDAAKRWRYKPYLVNGNPAELETENTFRLVYPW